MAILTLPEQTLALLQAAAAARRVPLEIYLAEVAAEGTKRIGATTSVDRTTQRMVAANSIEQLAAEIATKSTITNLIADKHLGHKY